MVIISCNQSNLPLREFQKRKQAQGKDLSQGSSCLQQALSKGSLSLSMGQVENRLACLQEKGHPQARVSLAIPTKGLEGWQPGCRLGPSTHRVWLEVGNLLPLVLLSQ